jgi:ABC-type lipoprotein release transport system permease subunit
VAIPLSYNLRSVLQKPVATLTTALGIAFTVTIFIGALALSAGFAKSLQKTGSPDNVILLRKGADSEISSGISLEAASIVAAMPDVAVGADGRPLFSAELVVIAAVPKKNTPGSMANILVRGVDRGGLGLRGAVRVTEGRMFEPGADEVIVGKHLPERFEGLAIGDRLKLGARDALIVGRFEAEGSSFETEIWGDARTLMPIFRGEAYQSITLRLRDRSRFQAWKDEVAKDPRLALDASVESEFYGKQSELFTTIVTTAGVFITSIMAVGAIFGAMNTMFASVGARTKEIGTLLILGFQPWALLLSFLVESVVVSFLGGLLGCVLALPINGITTSTTNFASFSELAFAFAVTPRALGAGLAYAVLMGLIGGAIPASRASRQSLAASLREA